MQLALILRYGICRDSAAPHLALHQLSQFLRRSRRQQLAPLDDGVAGGAMLHVRDINAVTGYIRGGCTAVGMKKQYVTRIDQNARSLDRIIVSGGKLGMQLELAPQDLAAASGAEFADIILKLK